MYNAGMETTHGTLIVFFLAMMLHPDKQRLAQAELDRVIGKRKPTFDDIPHLPYLNAVTKEVIRWNPVAPLGLPRQASEEDIYKGFYIPERTIVMPNIWAIAFLPNGKHDPQKFIPERFLEEGSDSTIDPSTYAFGFGIRVCPGKDLAQKTLSILIAYLLFYFDITPTDSTSPIEFTPGAVSYPQPFQCKIKPCRL